MDGVLVSFGFVRKRIRGIDEGSLGSFACTTFAYNEVPQCPMSTGL